VFFSIINSLGIRSLRQNSLQELTELVHKGEKKGIFHGRMPAPIQRAVREENLQFMKNRDIYDADYFQFVHKLAAVNASCIFYS
jgi:ubiquitin carboxyl-terminal hydrolase 9/24